MPKSLFKTGTLFLEYCAALIIAIIYLAFSGCFILSTLYISSDSMEKTLFSGDRIFVNRYIFRSSLAPDILNPRRGLRRGDVVVFGSPTDSTKRLVQRCVGLPGETIAIRNKSVFINNRRLNEQDYVSHNDRFRIFPDRQYVDRRLRKRDNFSTVKIGKNEYFFIGDNRDLSYDSRFFGTVSSKHIKGRAVIVYWSLKDRPLERNEKFRFAKVQWQRLFEVIQ